MSGHLKRLLFSLESKQPFFLLKDYCTRVSFIEKYIYTEPNKQTTSQKLIDDLYHTGDPLYYLAK